MIEPDFREIAPRCGGQREAFEEFCCQLAARTLPQELSYTRLRGAGGDGGVEFFADMPEGTRKGWQAKYVFDIDSLLVQAAKSLSTALNIHKTLTHYVVCFPFNLTGPTGRRGRSGQQKFDDWRKEYENKAASDGRQLTIEPWPESKLLSLLLDYDAAGGIREFFFNSTVLSPEWFSAHLESVKETAGPRYTPELNVETDLWKWFAAFGRTENWSHGLADKIRLCREPLDHLASVIERAGSDPSLPELPNDLRQAAQSVAAEMLSFLEECSNLVKTEDVSAFEKCTAQLDGILNRLLSLESRLADALECEHGLGHANSPGFRQFMAEYMLSFPAAYLDYVRDAIKAFQELCEWLRSPAFFLAFERAFFLIGAAGVGKTHGVCDAANQRFGDGLLTCVAFGHAFGGEPNPWTRLLETLGLPLTIGMNGLLDALNAAGEASHSPLIILVDAINETRPLRYWRERLATVVQQVQQRPYLRLCITCRTSFVPYCLPEEYPWPIVEHEGFAGIERDACEAFFQYYGLEPPIAPILQPELSNPLYLRLMCETVRAHGLRRLPAGWIGLAPVIREFLNEKEKQFSVEHETSTESNIIKGSLRKIARTIAATGNSALSWSHAQRAISEERPQARNLQVLEWLVRADLLVEDAPETMDPLGEESVVRPAFERLGDFLIAGELLDKTDSTHLESACQSGGLLYSLLVNRIAVGQNRGVVEALSILIPERLPATELPNLLEAGEVRTAVLEITISSFPLRDPNTLSSASRSLMQEALSMRELSRQAMDVAISVSWQPSAIDAFWLNEFLKPNPLARRDSFWCKFLHDRYQPHGSVKRLIDAAFELPLDQIDVDIAERWATILLLFTAAADRRVKDCATRAVTAILAARPIAVPSVLQRLLDSDDDEIRERALLSCYGSLIISPDVDVLAMATSALQSEFRNNMASFDNALIRDHIRCISELALELNALPDNCDTELTLQPIGSEWPLSLPSDEEVKRWNNLPKLAHSCLEDDFFIYSMNCLRPWDDGMTKKDMGKWILQRVSTGFGYDGSGCEEYDRYMLGRYGGGRAREMWAERIGKKYQWVAMYHLASRLHDHVQRRHDSRTPEPQRTPLILLEERKLDPTIPLDMIGGERGADGWWIRCSADFSLAERLPDAKWATSKEDLPGFDELLAVQVREGQRWRLLVSYPTWRAKDKDTDSNKPYRYIWIHVNSYLIPKKETIAAYDCLYCRNFFGRWMPTGASFLYGFAGEYPWATPFNTEPDEWHGWEGNSDDFPVSYLPSWNSLAVEWEYDASLPQNFHMMLPAREFFVLGDLWWDGKDGYRLINGRTVLRDPSVTEGGSAALIVDADDLHKRLDKLGMRLMWTLLGEKLIVGSPRDKSTPRRTFSQVARLEEDGSVKMGELVFFDDYDQDTGPLPVKRQEKVVRKKAKRRRNGKKRSNRRS